MIILTLIIAMITTTGFVQVLSVLAFIVNVWGVYRKEKVNCEENYNGDWHLYFKDSLKTKKNDK